MDPLTLSLLIGGGSQLLGGIFSGMGQSAAQDKQNALTREQLLAQQRQFNAGLENQMGQFSTSQGLNATQLDPLAQQASRQKQALMAAVLPGLRNVHVSSDVPGMNQFIPNIQGGLRIPEGGFGPETLSFFSPESRANAEGQFWKAAAPVVSPPDLSQVGYGQAGQGMTTPALQANQDALARNKAILASLGQQVAGAPRPRPKRSPPTGQATEALYGRQV